MIDVEAIHEEAALLEAAVHDAIDARQRKQASGSVGPPMGSLNSPHHIGDVRRQPFPYAGGPSPEAEYGARLKAWIDMHVDARLNQMMPTFDRELASMHHENDTVARICQRMEAEIDMLKGSHEMLKGSQAKTFDILDGVNSEVERLKVQGEALSAVESIVLTVEELKLSLRDQSPRSERALADLKSEMRSLGPKYDDMHLRFQELHQAHQLSQEQHRRSTSELSEAAGAMVAMRQEVGDLVALVEQHENKLGTWRSAITSEVTEELRKIDGLEQLCKASADLEARLNNSLQHVHSELMKELALQQQRLIAELKAETTTAFKSEAAAVAALDEQLWLTDQRLGQRIDELVQSHRDAMRVVEKRVSGVLQNRLASRESPRDRAKAVNDELELQREILRREQDAEDREASEGVRTLRSSGPGGLAMRLASRRRLTHDDDEGSAEVHGLPLNPRISSSAAEPAESSRHKDTVHGFGSLAARSLLQSISTGQPR